mmetsp:Transcript_81076/g.229687  ORF Transcript_81076/g.229687 Transcript_81076/m.229687 type:complete len:375 (+) Transcript_81076:121-1245(+)
MLHRPTFSCHRGQEGSAVVTEPPGGRPRARPLEPGLCGLDLLRDVGDVVREDAAAAAHDGGPAGDPLRHEGVVVLLGAEVAVLAGAAGGRHEAVGVAANLDRVRQEAPQHRHGDARDLGARAVEEARLQGGLPAVHALQGRDGLLEALAAPQHRGLLVEGPRDPARLPVARAARERRPALVGRGHRLADVDVDERGELLGDEAVVRGVLLEGPHLVGAVALGQGRQAARHLQFAARPLVARLPRALGRELDHLADPPAEQLLQLPVVVGDLVHARGDARVAVRRHDLRAGVDVRQVGLPDELRLLHVGHGDANEAPHGAHGAGNLDTHGLELVPHAPVQHRDRRAAHRRGFGQDQAEEPRCQAATGEPGPNLEP